MKLFQRVACFFLGALSLNLQAIDYTIQDLGTLANEESHASGINNHNTIVGYTKQGTEVNTFIWTEKEGLIFLPHPKYQLPIINNHNQVTDIYWHRTKTNYWFASNVDFRSKHIYVYENGNIQGFDQPEQWETQKIENWQTPSNWDKGELGIISFNDQQQMLIANSKTLQKATRFAIGQNGVFKEIDSSIINIAYGMNNHGLILARKWVQTDNVNVPMLVLYNPADGSITEIVKDINLVNRQLNDKGEVIIFKTLFKGMYIQEECKGFLWSSEKGLNELKDFAPMAFNNRDQIVGVRISKMQTIDSEILLWTPTETISLNQFLKCNGESLWTKISTIYGINDNGYITGDGLFDSKTHAFVIKPTH